MLSRIYCLSFHVLLSLTSGVTGQILTLDRFNNSLTTSTCIDSTTVFEGERIVLTATLNASQTNTSDWPVHTIILQQVSPTSKIICQIHIERDECRGLRPDVCGYCDSQDGQLYQLVFNFSAVQNDQSYATFRCTWVGTSLSGTYSTPTTSVYIAGYPYSRTSYYQLLYYRVQDVTRQTFLPSSNYTTFTTSFPGTTREGNLTWRYRTDLVDNTVRYNYIIDLNTTIWDSHIDDVIDIRFGDNCNRNWTFAIPVTDRPVVVCDLPVTSRSNETGIKVQLTCRMSTPQNPPVVYCSVQNWFQLFFVGNVTIDDDLITCTVNNIYRFDTPNIRTDLYLRWTYILDTQFTNGTQQLPRVVRLNVNGSKSITVEPGANITFECKVYGNPSARSVLMGPGAGRIQEYWSTTDLVHYTLTGVQCLDSGRYRCKGVSPAGETPREKQSYVDVNVRCPTTIASHVPSNKDRKFYLDPGSPVLITLEVYGYPSPSQFGLLVQQGSASVDVSRDRYTITYVEISPSNGLVSLLMSTNKTEGPQTYVISMSNGYNTSEEFQFELGGVLQENQPESQSPWLHAFIAVMCVVGAAIIIIVVIYLVKKHKHLFKREGGSTFDDIRSGESKFPDNKDKHTREHENTASSSTSHQRSQEPGQAVPTPESGNTSHYDTIDQDEIYENAAFENRYEHPA